MRERLDWTKPQKCADCVREMRPRSGLKIANCRVFPEDAVVFEADGRCKSCYNKSRDASPRITRYGISVEQYNSYLEAQNYSCAVCKISVESYDRSLSVDHDHSCCPDKLKSCGKCVRGLLCVVCNTALGHFKDSEVLLRRAAEYLSSEERYVPHVW